MSFDLPALPYEMNALEPYISTTTMEYHYGKHHRTYVENLNKLVKDTEFAAMSLEDVVKNTADNPSYALIFNNAAQAWNHAFFWNCMSPNGGGRPEGELLKKLNAISVLMKTSVRNLKMPLLRSLAAAGLGWPKKTASFWFSKPPTPIRHWRMV